MADGDCVSCGQPVCFASLLAPVSSYTTCVVTAQLCPHKSYGLLCCLQAAICCSVPVSYKVLQSLPLPNIHICNPVSSGALNLAQPDESSPTVCTTSSQHALWGPPISALQAASIPAD